MEYKVKEIKLKNGASGLLIDVPSVRVMRFNIGFMGGTLLCPDDKTDLAHMLEHMVLKANTQYRTEKDFVIEICKNGASINAYTSYSGVNYVSSCGDFEWERVLKLITSAISQPLLLPEHFSTELRVVREEMTGHLDNYPRIVTTSIDKAGGGVDLTPKARIDNLANLNLADLKEFYNRTHFAANMRFIIAGNLKGREEQVKAILENLNFSGSGKERLLRPEINMQPIKTPVALDETTGKLYFEFRAVHPDKRRFTLHELTSLGILHELLIGSAGTGLAARINGQAREKGLTYGIRCGWGSVHEADIDLSGSMNKENAPTLFDLIAEEIKKVLNGELPTKEIEEMKQRFLGSHRSRELTSARLINYYSDYTILNEGEEYYGYDADIDILPSINKQDIIKTLKSLLAGPWYLGILGPQAAEIKDDLYRRIGAVINLK